MYINIETFLFKLPFEWIRWLNRIRLSLENKTLLMFFHSFFFHDNDSSHSISLSFWCNMLTYTHEVQNTPPPPQFLNSTILIFEPPGGSKSVKKPAHILDQHTPTLVVIIVCGFCIGTSCLLLQLDYPMHHYIANVRVNFETPNQMFA